jgi:hypothetical protein
MHPGGRRFESGELHERPEKTQVFGSVLGTESVWKARQPVAAWMRSYVEAPAEEKPWPRVVVIHDAWGTTTDLRTRGRLASV